MVGSDKMPPLIPRMMNRLTTPKSAPEPMLRFHRWIYIRSGGRVGPGMIGAWTTPPVHHRAQNWSAPGQRSRICPRWGQDHSRRLERRSGPRTGLVPQSVRQVGGRGPTGSKPVRWKRRPSSTHQVPSIRGSGNS